MGCKGPVSDNPQWSGPTTAPSAWWPRWKQILVTLVRYGMGYHMVKVVELATNKSPAYPLHTPGYAAHTQGYAPHTQGYAGLSRGPLMPPKACSLTLNLILPLTAQYTYLFHVSHAALFVIAQYGMAWVGPCGPRLCASC